MIVKKTKFKGILLFNKKSFTDTRGYFREIFKKNYLNKNFKFEYLSLSKKNVIRGLHLQTRNPQAKFITVLKGKIFDIALDLRKNSKTFGKYHRIILSGDKNHSIYIPEGFAHGFCTLENDTLMHYNCTEYRDIKSETGIQWNDIDLKIKWPINNPILSQKDKKNISFKSFMKNYKKELS